MVFIPQTITCHLQSNRISPYYEHILFIQLRVTNAPYHVSYALPIQVTAAVKQRIPMLRHLPLECDVLLVEIDLANLVSPDVLLPFQAELDKRAGKRKDRAKRAQKEKKRDLDHMLAQTLHIEEIKALARTESERKLGMIRELINGPALSMHAGGDAVGDGTGNSIGGVEGDGGGEEATSVTNKSNPEGSSHDSSIAEGSGLGPGLGPGLSVEGDSLKISSIAAGPPVLSFAKITQVHPF